MASPPRTKATYRGELPVDPERGTLEIGGQTLRVVFLRNPVKLFRGNDFYVGIPPQDLLNARATYTAEVNNVTKLKNFKYFTRTLNETRPYQGKKPFVKTWAVREGETLTLVDILDPATRQALVALLGGFTAPILGKGFTNALNHSFPLRNGRVQRISEANRVGNDDTVIHSICTVGGLDGYYMERQEGEGVQPFHSEIAVCKAALGKLVLVASERGNVPVVSRRNQTRNRSRSRNRNKTQNRFKNIPRIRRSVPLHLGKNNIT